MRLIKAQNTNLRNIYGKGVKYDTDDLVTVDSQRAITVPKGTYFQQPGFAGDINYPAVESGATEGQIRYNTSTNQLEAYQNGAWRSIRFKEPNQDPGIIQQNVGTGNLTATDIIFGPLNNQDSNHSVSISTPQNILVFVENVFQISTTNYTIVQNPDAVDEGSEVDATTIVDGEQYKIMTVGNTDYTLYGAVSNTVNEVFTADLQGGSLVPAGTGTVRSGGYYLKFASPVPTGKPVTVLHNFDK